MPAPKETVLRSETDPDFGALDLVETRSWAGITGQPLREIVLLGWRGRIESLNVQFGVCDDLTGVTLAARADFKRAVGDINAVKRVAAERMLETAKDWAEQGEMKINVGEAMLASSLRLESIDVGASRVTLYFDETAGVFAGHGVEVRIEGGEVSEVGLCG